MDYSAMGKRVRIQRKELGITQEQLAEKIGISCSFMGHIERGTRKLSVDTLVALSDALCVSCDVLLQDSLKPILPSDEMIKRIKVLSEIDLILRENDV